MFSKILLTINHNNIIEFQLPNDWVFEENDESLAIYNPSGEGAITISFYSLLQSNSDTCEQISVMAKKYANQNRIKLDKPLVVYHSSQEKTILYGTGHTNDNWFIKFWMIAQHPRAIHASYLCRKKSQEIKSCDSIIESIRFIS